ncbi:MAG: MarR family transcriptional regulator [Clostridium sp.]|nr:MarR family transcriptional regulator [Clostridium sp.]
MAALKKDNVMRLLKQLNLTVEMMVNHMFVHNDLTASQCDVLSCLMDHGKSAVSATLIHRELGLSRAAVSALLKRLKVKGYLVFETAPHDDRQKLILLTDKARRIEQEMDEKAEVIKGCLYRGFSKEEQEALEGMIRRMLCNLKAEQRSL